MTESRSKVDMMEVVNFSRVELPSTCSSGTFVSARGASSLCSVHPAARVGQAVSMLTDSKEVHVPAVQACVAHACLSPERLDGSVDVCGQEPGIDHAERWDQDKWEAAGRLRRRALLRSSSSILLSRPSWSQGRSRDRTR